MDWVQWLKALLDDLRQAAQPPQHTAPTEHETAAPPEGRPDKTRYTTAIRFLEHRQYDQAKQEFLRTAEEEPELAADAYAGAACAARSWTGRYEFLPPENLAPADPNAAAEAARLYERGLAADPNHARCMVGLAQTLPADDPRRIELLARAAQLKADANLQLWLGDALLAAGRVAEAQAAYEESARQAPRADHKPAIKRLLSLAEAMNDTAARKRWARELSKPRGSDNRVEWLDRRGKPIPAHVDEHGSVICPKCRAKFRTDDPRAWSGRRHMACDQLLKLDAPTEPSPIWCLVANVVEERTVGPGEIKERGTRLFRAGAKVYCYPPLWGDGYENIRVIGHHRASKRLIRVVMSWKWLTNWRVQLVYHPAITDALGGSKMWDGTEQSRQKAETLCTSMKNRSGSTASEK
jgi:hypothetical protein